MGFSFEELEANIKQSQGEVSLGKAIDRLFSNSDFKQVVLNGYFEKEAVRLVHAKADIAYDALNAHENIVRQLDAIGNFRKYLKSITVSAELATKAIEADEQTRDELLKEDLNNGQ